MGRYLLGFPEIDQTQIAVIGGKGAHLGELSRIEGLRVPAGFCVTTDAFQFWDPVWDDSQRAGTVCAFCRATAAGLRK